MHRLLLSTPQRFIHQNSRKIKKYNLDEKKLKRFMFREDHTGFIHFQILKLLERIDEADLISFHSKQFSNKMNKCSLKFGVCEGIHNWIVDHVNEK